MESIKTWIGADGVEECHCLAIDEVEVIKHGETDCDIVGGLYRSRSFIAIRRRIHLRLASFHMVVSKF